MNEVFRIAIDGSPTLTIDEGNSTATGLATATDASTTFSRVNNVVTKLTAQIDSALPTGLTLAVVFDGLGTNTDLDVGASSAAAVDVATSIALGATSNGTITYSFTATPDAGTVNIARVVTYTLTTP